MKTSAPASTNPRAIALPSPLLPPVTRATRPFRLNSELCIDVPLRLANGTWQRLNVRAGFSAVKQPIPGCREGRRVVLLDTRAKNGTIRQNHLIPPACRTTSTLLHLKPFRTPLYTGAVARPSRNHGINTISVQIDSIMPDQPPEIKSSRLRNDW